MGLSTIHYTITNAQLEEWCVLTGQYYTGEYQTGCIEIPEELTGGYLECETIPGYWTGWILNESGDRIDQVWVEESQNNCVLTGQTIIPAYITGCSLIWGYRTGGTLLCEEDNDKSWIMNNGWNGICESWDIIRSRPLSWAVLGNVLSVRWSYSWDDCTTVSWLILQLWDHNGQWITINSLASGTTQYSFDSKPLYSFQQSGFYHILGTGISGQQYLYTGTYTWLYSYFFTWYKFRFLTPDATPLNESVFFTIDNQVPTLTWMSLTSSWSTTWYVTLSGVVVLSFTANELLDDLDITLGSKHPNSFSHSWLDYSYTWIVSSLYPEGNLVADIRFDDEAGNTGVVLYTGQLILDITSPTATGFVFSDSADGVVLDFTTSEPVTSTFTFWNTWVPVSSWSNTHYLTAHHISFSGVARDQLYTFTLNVMDPASNVRSITGDFVWTNLGQIISHVYIVPAAEESLLTGNLATLAVIMKAEVEKFNACKNKLTFTPVEVEVRRNSFIIQMPKFKKSQIKTLVNAFTLFVLDKIKTDYKITKSDVDTITHTFDNFLVILKLLRDDDNECKQNLSNYHISQFKRALVEYNINLE